MASKEELEAREADCRSAADFAALAVEAKDVDADYVKAMLEKAEMQCQMPPGYVAAAEGAIALGLTDYAQDLFEAAPERLKLAEAVIKDTGDKAYAGEVYGRAAESLAFSQ